MNNAAKYIKEGSVRFSICGYPEDRPTAGERKVLTIIVQDTGIGIRQEDIGKQFQKLERVDLEVNSTVEGTGLGLAITQSQLDMMGGSIVIQSTYVEGSTFTITLPQMVVSTEPVCDFEEKYRRSLLETSAYRDSFMTVSPSVFAGPYCTQCHALLARPATIIETATNTISRKG